MFHFEFKKIIYIVLALFTTICVYRGIENALRTSPDFEWDGAKILYEKENPYTRSGSHFKLIELEKLGSDTFEIYSQLYPHSIYIHMYPPSLYMILFPFANMSWNYAKSIWLFLNLFMTFFVLYFINNLFFKKYHKYFIIFLSGIILCSIPWRNGIASGQQVILCILFFLMGLKERLKGRRITSGFLFGLSLIKFNCTLPLMVAFAAELAFFEISIAILFQIFMTFLASQWLGENFFIFIGEYIRSVREGALLGTCDIMSNLGNSGNKHYLIFSVIFFLFLTAVVIKFIVKNLYKNKTSLIFACLSIYSLLMFYHYIYDFFILVFPLIYIFEIYAGPYSRVAIVVTVGYFWFFQAFFISLWAIFSPRTLIFQGWVEFSLLTITLFILIWESSYSAGRFKQDQAGDESLTVTFGAD